jgi:hypothetical protein|tara:strand:- start:7281 stop:7775 length:495 start_codon:yes stop_codon:yes gene_type:complete
MTQTTIFEGLTHEEMQGLVNSVISIDQYKPKIGENSDTVVVALTVQYEKPARDLSNFIETGVNEHLDVEASPAPNEDGEYKVFVEFDRNEKLFQNIEGMLSHITKITSDNGDWEYTGYKLDDPRSFDQERFARDIITDPQLYREKFEPTAGQEIAERMDFLVNY